jgi:hypothetical protein
MRKGLGRQPYLGNPTVRDENGGFGNRTPRNGNMRPKSIQTVLKKSWHHLTFYEKVVRASRPDTGRDGLATFSYFALPLLFKDVQNLDCSHF